MKCRSTFSWEKWNPEETSKYPGGIFVFLSTNDPLREKSGNSCLEAKKVSGGEQSNLRYVFACACDAEQVPRIAELRETVTGIKNELVEQTSQAFNQVGQLASSTADPEGFHRDADVPGQFRSLQEACLVVDALGGQARQQQVTCLFKVFRHGCPRFHWDKISRSYMFCIHLQFFVSCGLILYALCSSTLLS